MMTETEPCSDTQLVDRCLGGDREAFGRIVERYQGLVCALTYNACATSVGVETWPRKRSLRHGAISRV